MTYNLTPIGNSTGLLGFFQLVNNNIMSNMMGVLMLFVIAVISFMAFLASTNDAGKSLTAASFIAAGLSIMLRAVDLVPNLAMFICIILAGLVTAFSFKK